MAGTGRSVGLCFGIVVCVLILPARASAADLEPELVTQVGHASQVSDIVCSADGRWLLSASRDGTIQVRNHVTLELHRVLTASEPRLLTSLAISRDGTRVTASGVSPLIPVWDLPSGRLLMKLREPVPPESSGELARISISPDGTMLASVRAGRPVHLWQLKDGTLTRTLGDGQELIQDVGFSPDGRLLAASGRNGTRLWQVDTGELRRTFLSRPGDDSVNPRKHAWSPDGSQLAQVSNRMVWDAGHDWRSAGVVEITLWEAETGRRLNTISWPSQVHDVAWSPDGNYLAIAGTQTAVWRTSDWRIVEMPTFRRRFQIETIESTAVAVAPAIERTEPVVSESVNALEPASRIGNSIDLVFACQDCTLRLKPVNAADPFQWIDSRDGAMLLPRLLAGNRIAVQGHFGRFTIWDLESGTLSEARHYGQSEMRDLLAVSPDGRRVIRRHGPTLMDRAIELHDRGIERHGAPIRHQLLEESRYGYSGAAFSADGRRFLVCDGINVAHWRQDEDGLHRVSMQYASSGRAPLDLSADGGLLAVCQNDWEWLGQRSLGYAGKDVALIDTRTGEAVIRLSHSDVADAVLLSPDAELVATGAKNGRTQIWETVTGKRLRSLSHDGHEQNTPLAWSRDGKRLLTGRRSTSIGSMHGLTLWDVATGRTVWTTRRFLSRKAVFSQNGNTIVIGDADWGTLNFISAKNGQHLASMRMFEENGNSNPVWITYTPEGHFVTGHHGERMIRWRIGDRLVSDEQLNLRFNQPDVIRKRLESGTP
jgi:WD40 repeat protein